MKYILLILILMVGLLLVETRMDDSYQEGYKAGVKSALKIPPSEELEMVCAGLWFGDQAKKYYEKENRRAR